VRRAGRGSRLAIGARRRRLLIAVAWCLLLACAAGCGNEASTEGVESVQGVGEQRGGSSAALAQCSDWRKGSVAERQQTIVDLRDQLTAQSSETAESDLSDEDAYDLFERVCAQEYAVGFRLYKVYGQAAAFEPLRSDGGQ
jgi:hypothetical protein